MAALDACLLIGDNRVIAHLGAGCRYGQNNTNRQAGGGFSLLYIEIPDVALLRIRDSVGNTLGGVNDTAAADCQDKIYAFFLSQFNPLIDEAQMRIGNNTAQRNMADALCVEGGADSVDQAGADRALAAIMDQDLLAALRADQLSESVLRAFSENDFCRCIIIKISGTNHPLILSFLHENIFRLQLC